MATQTYAALTNEQRTYYVSRLIKRLLPYLPVLQDAQRVTVPANTGTAVQFRKVGALALATSALTEGTPPVDSSLTVTTVTAALAQYGAFVKVSDLLIKAGIDPMMASTVDVLGEQAGQTIHNLMMAQLGSGSSVQYAAARASRITVAAGDNFIVAEVKKAVRTLEGNNAPKFSDGFYHGVLNPRQKYDLIADSAFQDLYRYTNTTALRGNEVGEVYGVRFMATTDTPVFTGAGAAGIDVYAALIYGPDAFASIDLAGMGIGSTDPDTNKGINVMVVPADSPSKLDPLNQYGLAGWKIAFVAKVLDVSRIIRIESAVSA